MRILSFIENTISGLLFIIGVIVSLYGVFMRYFIGHSVSWATEFYTMFIVWAIFIGFSTALRDDKHISINILVDRASFKLQKVFEIIALIVGCAFSLFFIWAGIEVVISSYNQGSTSIDAGFPVWINYLILPISGFLLFIRLFERTILSFRKEKVTNKGGDSK